jgi:oligopeptide transport system ATP-binding protein
MTEPILTVRDLDVRFATKRGVAHVVRGIDLDLRAGETVAIVGESGSGKSVATLAMTKLIPMPPGEVRGQVRLGGDDLVPLPEKQLLGYRGRRIAYVFQDPMTSLNPVHTVGRQITEMVRFHLHLDAKAARERAIELLRLVGIPEAEQRIDDYPHSFSGGMRQRVVIAIGLSCNPEVLVADEATTALDVTTQAQIVDLITRLQDELGMGVIWITHDLGVVAGIADHVLVMYAGQVVESAAVDDLYLRPRHPYTVGLMRSLPLLGAEERRDLAAIPGLPPAPTALPPGCAFHPRCAFRHDRRCAEEAPPLREVAPGHLVRSFYEVPDEIAREAAAAARLASDTGSPGSDVSSRREVDR